MSQNEFFISRKIFFQSLQTVELLQDVIYSHQSLRYSDTAVYSEEKNNWTEDSLVLYSFLQRAISKPLVVSAGGVVELTRSFLVSVRQKEPIDLPQLTT
jgi:hypothetical protein